MKLNFVLTDPKNFQKHPEHSAWHSLRLPLIHVQCDDILPYGLEAFWGSVSTLFWKLLSVNSPLFGFSPLVAESVTRCHLPSSDTPGVEYIKNHRFIYVCEFLTLCFWFLFRGLRTVEGLPYFTNILEIAFELYVLVTTANSPDVMYVHLDSRSWAPVTMMEFTLLKAAVSWHQQGWDRRNSDCLFIHVHRKNFWRM